MGGLRSADALKAFEKGFEFFDEGFLLFLAVAAAEAGHGWHDAIDIRTRGFECANSKSVINKRTRLLLVEAFVVDQLHELFLALRLHKGYPLQINIVVAIVQRMNEVLHQLSSNEI